MGAAPVNVTASRTAKKLIVKLKDFGLDQELDLRFFDFFDHRVAQSAASPKAPLGIQPKLLNHFAQLLGSVLAFQAENVVKPWEAFLRAAASKHNAFFALGYLPELRGGHLGGIQRVIAQKPKHPRQASEHAIRDKADLKGAW